MYNQIPLQQLPLAVPMQQMSSQPNSYTNQQLPLAVPMQQMSSQPNSYANQQLPLAVPMQQMSSQPNSYTNQQLPLAVPMQQMSSQPNSLSTILPILLNISTILEKLETRIDKIENIKKVKLESFSPSPDSDSETQGVIGDIRKLMRNIPNPFQYSSNY